MKTEPEAVPAPVPAGRADVAGRQGPLAILPKPAREDVVRALRHSLGVFLALRIFLSVVALIGIALLPDLTRLSPGVRLGLPPIPLLNNVPGWAAHPITPGWHNVFTAFERFDALWFLSIARHGYVRGNQSAVFFPLYPLLIRAVSWAIGGHPFAASLIVSNGAFLGALFVLYLLTQAEFSEEVARKAVVYAAVFPTAFFFLAPYSESLFLLLVLLAFWFARRSRWWLAAPAAFLAALTRNLGVLLVLPLAAEAIHQAIITRPRRLPVVGLAASAFPVLGAGAYLWFCHARFGSWLAPITQQTSWERHRVSPLTTARMASQDAYRFIGIYPGGYHTLDWVIGVAVVAAAAYAIFRFRPSYSLYAWASILAPMSYIFDGRPLLSFPRFALVIFPVFWAFAKWTEGRPRAHELVVGCSAALLGLMLLLFVNWFYIF
jgi:hypothetical protein